MSWFILGSSLRLLGCPLLLGVRFFLLCGAFSVLYWNFFSIKTGAICLYLLVRDSLISWSCSGFRSFSRSAMSLVICDLVLLYVFCRSSNNARVISVLHFLTALVQLSLSTGFLVLLILNLKSTLVGKQFLLSLDSIVLMVKNNYSTRQCSTSQTERIRDSD